MNVFRVAFLIITLHGIVLSGITQTIQKGIPFVKNYLPVDYEGNGQNWAIIQDSRGVMYFGNTKGLMEFDGTYWRFIDPINVFVAQKNNIGRIFVAGNHDYGYLSTNGIGEVIFKSLKPLLPKEVKELSDFYSIAFTSSEVLFGEHSGRIHVYNYEKTEIIQTGFSSMQIANVYNTIFVGSKKGLFVLKDKKLSKAKGSESFKGYSVVGIFEFNKNALIVTRLNGLFIYNGKEIKHWEINADHFLKTNQVYRATKVDSTHMAFGTVENGLLITDETGYPVQHVNSKGGMVSQDHCAIYTDSWGNIWSGLENGISQIQINSPFTFYNEQSGLNNSAIFSMQMLQNKLYVGTAQGVMYRDFNTTENPLSRNVTFKYVNNNKGRKVWDMFSYDDKIITGYSNTGTYSIINHKANKLFSGHTPQLFVSDSSGNYRVCIKQHGGLLVLKKSINGIKLHTIFENKFQVDYLAKDSLENYWCSVNNGELIKITFSNDYSKITRQETYTANDGLPAKSKIAPFNIGSSMYFGTSEGTYSFNYTKNTFKPFTPINSKCPAVFIYKTVKNGPHTNYFLGMKNTHDVLGIIKYKNASLDIKTIEKPLKKISPFEIKSLLPIDSNHFLLGCIDRLVQFDPSNTMADAIKYKVLLRSVEIISANDSLVFGGSYTKPNKKDKPIEFVFKNNALRFKYSAVFFDENDKTEYTCRLKGNYDNWSEWSHKTEKEYSYLKQGNYKFEVRAKNIYGEEIMMKSYSFIIHPPWYFTTVAWMIYMLVVGLLTRLIILFSIRKIQREKTNLEQIVFKRTKQIASQRDEILNKNTTLETQKKELSGQYSELTKHRQKTLDSLKYAEYIQSSLLARPNDFEDSFSDYFILFKPKDIVSGDFYWLKQNKDTIFVAAADSTGHGVPGAFMSVIGISFLNEIIQQKTATTPALILETLRQQVKSALNPELNKQKSDNLVEMYINSKIKDGMDIALCAINNKTKILSYAGANLPMFILRNGEFIEFEPTGNPIGVYLIETPFTNHNFQLQTNDIIYLFSDGYYDQFGGEHNKKFYVENFKKILLKIHTLPCKKQNEILTKTIEDWQGLSDQIDDILVMGLRI